jgi:hypothetical protein
MPVHEQIVELLSMPSAGEEAPTLARLEDTLTEGYAAALALEAERLRIERRLGEVARSAGNGTANGVAQELASLSRRLTTADGELTRLRMLLGSLRDRARAARNGAGRAR